MAEKNIKKTSVAEGHDDPVAGDFRGYTMEELRYQRAIVALKKEFCKAKVIESVRDIREPRRKKEKGTKQSGAAGALSLAGRVASVVFSNLNTLDYVVMGLSAFGTVKKGIKLIRGKK